MPIQPLTNRDWCVFAEWATAENWKIPFQEQRLFQNRWRPYFFVLKEQGECCGFVSAVAYKGSGWIGNLLIDPRRRGRAYGTRLFEHALAFLDQPKTARVWLTASNQGAPLYRKYGFIEQDRVERWSAQGQGSAPFLDSGDLDDLIYLDSHSWGESREPLLSILESDSRVLRQETTMALLQTGLGFWQLGPWLAEDRSARILRLLLNEALAKTPTDKLLVTDILASAELELILRAAGFTRSGSNLLMCSSPSAVDYDGVMALASLGSIG